MQNILHRYLFSCIHAIPEQCRNFTPKQILTEVIWTSKAPAKQ
jgi:hypothetical protein